MTSFFNDYVQTAKSTATRTDDLIHHCEGIYPSKMYELKTGGMQQVKSCKRGICIIHLGRSPTTLTDKAVMYIKYNNATKYTVPQSCK